MIVLERTESDARQLLVESKLVDNFSSHVTMLLEKHPAVTGASMSVARTTQEHDWLDDLLGNLKGDKARFSLCPSVSTLLPKRGHEHILVASPMLSFCLSGGESPTRVVVSSASCGEEALLLKGGSAPDAGRS